MKLGLKSTLIIGGVVVTGGALMGVFAHTTLLDRFRAIEAQRSIQNRCWRRMRFRRRCGSWI